MYWNCTKFRKIRELFLLLRKKNNVQYHWFHNLKGIILLILFINFKNIFVRFKNCFAKINSNRKLTNELLVAKLVRTCDCWGGARRCTLCSFPQKILEFYCIVRKLWGSQIWCNSWWKINLLNRHSKSLRCFLSCWN